MHFAFIEMKSLHIVTSLDWLKKHLHQFPFQIINKLVTIRKFSFLEPKSLNTKWFIQFLLFFYFRFKGCGCTIFCDFSQRAYKSLNIKDLNYYIIISSDGSNFSAPILINKPIIRTAFGIQLNETNVNHFSKISPSSFCFYIIC